MTVRDSACFAVADGDQLNDGYFNENFAITDWENHLTYSYVDSFMGDTLNPFWDTSGTVAFVANKNEYQASATSNAAYIESSGDYGLPNYTTLVVKMEVKWNTATIAGGTSVNRQGCYIGWCDAQEIDATTAVGIYRTATTNQYTAVCNDGSNATANFTVTDITAFHTLVFVLTSAAFTIYDGTGAQLAQITTHIPSISKQFRFKAEDAQAVNRIVTVRRFIYSLHDLQDTSFRAT